MEKEKKRKERKEKFSTLAMANINVDFYIYSYFIGPFSGTELVRRRLDGKIDAMGIGGPGSAAPENRYPSARRGAIPPFIRLFPS